MKKNIASVLLLLIPLTGAFSQTVSNQAIQALIQSYKADLRGPYKEIRWFCPDGTMIPAKERCPEPGGVQRAVYKDEVKQLAISNHLFLGQILATTPHEDFWDSKNNNSRIKQYQLENYLHAIDNGWVLQRAQYYRGAFQAEDDEAWGIQFFNWLLNDTTIINRHFFLIRQAARDIPHNGDNNLKQNIRSNSKLISDSYPPFLNLRIKIHGQPDATDIAKVKAFRANHVTKISSEDLMKLDELIRDMTVLYKPFDISSLDTYISVIPKSSPIYKSLKSFQSAFNQQNSDLKKITTLSDILYALRKAMVTVNTTKARLAILDLSNVMEDLLFKVQGDFKPETLGETLLNLSDLGNAACGCGYLEFWEWERLKKQLTFEPTRSEKLTKLVDLSLVTRQMVEWSTGMFMANYRELENTYAGFEPLADGFIDDKIRSSLLLLIGSAVNGFGEEVQSYIPGGNQIMGKKGQNSFRGVNPGIAMGELIVNTAPGDDMQFDKDKIYIFLKPPSDLKPIAGIATVSDGNPVSHVQLLARSLGIPNAVLSLQNLEELKGYSGQKVFYAVSAKGAVLLKPVSGMTEQERALFVTKERDEMKIKVPIEKIKFNHVSVINLRDVNARFSGEVCGPKAANMGQLKQMFPESVVEGLVVPFGIFREHLEQTMPGEGISYWQYLNNQFKLAAEMKERGATDMEVENFMLKELEKIRLAIQKIKLSESFVADLASKFREVFGSEPGTIPVFLRSDTNMEDLKDFSGAGLNLTLFNVLGNDVILQGIRDVWASPYTERSYKWRQRYLLNPENVFPSILIIPSVDVDYSGVVVTKGVGSGLVEDITVAFSHGAGGAVDGQSAETYLIKPDGSTILLSPSREPAYKTLPATGGTEVRYATFEKPILSKTNLSTIQLLRNQMDDKFPMEKNQVQTRTFDMEMGFRAGKLWLFQVRPFVENKKALGSTYLESLNPVIPQNMLIDLSVVKLTGKGNGVGTP